MAPRSGSGIALTAMRAPIVSRPSSWFTILAVGRLVPGSITPLRAASPQPECVRLKRGLMEEATIFNTDPAAQARVFQSQGFEWLHCVDLNGAFQGRSANAEAIKAGSVDQVLPLDKIFSAIEKRVLYVFGAQKVGAL